MKSVFPLAAALLAAAPTLPALQQVAITGLYEGVFTRYAVPSESTVDLEDGTLIRDNVRIGFDSTLNFKGSAFFTGQFLQFLSGSSATFDQSKRFDGKILLNDRGGRIKVNVPDVTLLFPSNSAILGNPSFTMSQPGNVLINEGLFSKLPGPYSYFSSYSYIDAVRFINRGELRADGLGKPPIAPLRPSEAYTPPSTDTFLINSYRGPDDTTFTNEGLVSALGRDTSLVLGSLSDADRVTNLVNNSLTGGRWEARKGGRIVFYGPAGIALEKIDADLVIDGPTSIIEVLFPAKPGFRNYGYDMKPIEKTLVMNFGSLSILGGKLLALENIVENAADAKIELGDARVEGPGLTNSGLLAGTGTVAAPVTQTDTGVVLARGGTLVLEAGATGTGTLGSAADAQLVLVGGGETLALAQEGDLELRDGDLVVTGDYLNAKAGEGNAFSARTGVVGGRVLAGGDTRLEFGGEVSDDVVDFGYVPAGQAVTRTFTLRNAGGASAALLRGALKTADGGNLTDSRLSGTGVTAQNFGPLAAGEELTLTVTFTASSPGDLTQQYIQIESAYDNVPPRNLSLQGRAY